LHLDFADFERKIKCNRLKPTCEACQAFNCACIYGGSCIMLCSDWIFEGITDRLLKMLHRRNEAQRRTCWKLCSSV
jgi:hypothetical protein